jgi:hypothetical protein
MDQKQYVVLINGLPCAYEESFEDAQMAALQWGAENLESTAQIVHIFELKMSFEMYVEKDDLYLINVEDLSTEEKDIEDV